MSRASRGGLTLKTGKIGRCNVLRQQILMPGERMNVNINGSVRLESLRERDVMRINANLATFMTPLRWLWTDYPTYVKEGPTGAGTPPAQSVTDFAKYGVGTGRQDATSTVNMFKHFHDAPIKIYNEWYKWPEDADATDWDDDGNIAVPLQKAWTRARYKHDPDAASEKSVTSVSQFDVTDLAKVQAGYRSAMKRDVLSFNRWMELVKQTWKGDGSREVDQVPIMIDQTEVGVNPRDIPATDGASLGQWQSLYDFNINHAINGIVAPEHCIITYILTVRFPSITESVSPLAQQNNLDWEEVVADPEYLSAMQPVNVNGNDFFADGSATSFGYLPAGWQWRTDHDVIDSKIYRRNSFPYMNVPTTKAEAKDATRIKAAFRSQSLGDYMADVYFKEESYQPIGNAMDSYFAGMTDDARFTSGSNNEFPAGGKQI